MEPGKLYHIYNRGINSQEIFFEEENYLYFLKKYGQYLSPFTETYAYCLMPNHFHFLIGIKEAEQAAADYRSFKNYSSLGSLPRSLTGVDKAFRDFFISYAKSINKKFGRTGALFQQKFKKKEIEDESYYTALIAYIHLNPVKADLCKYPGDWKFSSFNSIISVKPTNMQRQYVLDWFGGKEEFLKFHGNAVNENKIKDLLFDED